MSARRVSLAALILSLAAFGCGDDGGTGADGDGGVVVDGDGTPIDGDGTPIPPPVDFDGGPIGGGEDCSPTSTECNNCEDDDEDGFIDGQDFECISPLDDDESSFATGIPGDNKDDKKQDCFFDGDSGQGNDGCDIDTCCLLDCPAEDPGDGSRPACANAGCFGFSGDCTISNKCATNCGAITPPGCDCFGCCTFCNETGCHDILTNPAVAPNCDEDVIDDPMLCPPCTKQADCGPEDCALDGDCILCPGEELPPECEMNECPDEQTPCDSNADCTNNEYCSQGCCNDGFVVQ